MGQASVPFLILRIGLLYIQVTRAKETTIMAKSLTGIKIAEFTLAAARQGLAG